MAASGASTVPTEGPGVKAGSPMLVANVPAGITNGRRGELQHRQNRRDLGESDPDHPLDQFGLDRGHFAPQLDKVGFRRKAEACERLVRVERADHIFSNDLVGNGYPPSSLGMKKTSLPWRKGCR